MPPVVPTAAAASASVPTGALYCNGFKRENSPDDPEFGMLFCATATTAASFAVALVAQARGAVELLLVDRQRNALRPLRELCRDHRVVFLRPAVVYGFRAPRPPPSPYYYPFRV